MTTMIIGEAAWEHRKMTGVRVDQDLRERAYFLWLDAGCPNGMAEEHWFAAQAAIKASPALIYTFKDAVEKHRAEPTISPVTVAGKAQRARKVHAA